MEDADDFHDDVFHAHVLAHGIDILVEQALDHVLAERHDLARLIDVERIRAPAERERDFVLQHEELIRDAVHVGVAVLLAVVHGDAVLRAVARDDAHAVDLLGDGLHVRFLELDLAPEAHALERHARVAGEQHDDVERLVAEILHHAVLHAAAGAEQQDEHEDAPEHAERRQQRAQLVLPQREEDFLQAVEHVRPRRTAS